MSNIEGVDPVMKLLREKVPFNELDYQLAMGCLKTFENPRAKLSRLLKSHALIRIRKGLYVLGPQFRRLPYCLEFIANICYGPSYISLESALQFYGLIPEHVNEITSVTLKISKTFATPIGNFSYSHIPQKGYYTGITMQPISSEQSCLIAIKEKALTDFLILRRGKVTSLKEMEWILLQDLRIAEEDLLSFDQKKIRTIHDAYPHSAIRFFERWIINLKKDITK